MSVPPRMQPLLAQLDMSLELSLQRMDGLTDAEFWWPPGPDSATVERDESGRLRILPSPVDTPHPRTIVLLVGHLIGMAVLRTDYTTGDHRMTTEDVDWPDTADIGIEFLRDSWADWRGALATLRDDELDVIGRCDYPDGLDPTLPVLDIAWWMNRELIHHTAEIAFIRDLYARRL